MSQETKSVNQPKKKTAKIALKLKKNYIEFGRKGDPVTAEIQKKAKEKGIDIKSIAE